MDNSFSGPAGLFTSPATAKTGLTNLAAGIYLVGLTVTDITNQMGRDTVQITVNAAPPPPPPIAHASGGQTITLPLDSVALNGYARPVPVKTRLCCLA